MENERMNNQRASCRFDPDHFQPDCFQQFLFQRGRFTQDLFRPVVYLIACTALLTGLYACGSPGDRDGEEGRNISGEVSGPAGPEAGVWVIAETDDLPTRFVRIVVTDEEGRYLLPDLPDATYDVWVRGYGLVDSPKTEAQPGSTLDLTAEEAPDPQAAAEYYPAAYWFSLLHVPEKSEFPGTGSGSGGNGISPDMETQADFLRNIKSGNCMACHQLGNKATREIPEELGSFDTTEDAWSRRIQSGQAGSSMISGINRIGREEALRMFADWTDRINAGEVPPAPPRPEGLERNVVITQWDWADPKVYLHDLVSTDRRDPTVNSNGPLYGALEASGDYLPVLDPINHETSRVPLTVRDPETEPAASQSMPQPSPYWGDESIWDSKANVHNPMLDGQGRVRITATVRPPENPEFC
ncbi:MAG: carboxypeptidase-like regulatory domain-containing protein, partial [Balneolaceae bacterium]